MKCRNCQIEYDDKLQACPLCDTPVMNNEAADVPGENAHPFEHRCSNCDHVFFGQGVDECPKCHSILRKPQALETQELFTKDKEYISQEQRKQLKEEEEKRKQKEELQDEILAVKRSKWYSIYKKVSGIITVLMLPLIYKLSWLLYEGDMLGSVLNMFICVPIFYVLILCFGLDIIDRIFKNSKTTQHKVHIDYQKEIYKSIEKSLIDNYKQK